MTVLSTTRFPEAVGGQVNFSVTGQVLVSGSGAGIRQSCYERRFALFTTIRLVAFLAKLFAKKGAERAPNLAKSSAVLRRKQTYSGSYGSALNRQVVGSIPTASTITSIK